MKLKLANSMLIMGLVFVLVGCAVKPTWTHQSFDTRQFYQDDAMCSQRGQQAMGSAGSGRPTSDDPYAKMGAAIGNAIAGAVGKRRAMNEYRRCMESLGYNESA